MKKPELYLLKVGGKILNDQSALNETLEAFSKMAAPKALIHGGGKKADEWLLRLGIEPVMINGRRVTDEQTLEIAVMAYAGWLNKNVVAHLQKNGVNAFGLSGADLDVIRAEKRASKPVDYGWVGDVKNVNIGLLRNIMNDAVPVFCAVTHDGAGQLLNTNADTIATELAIAFSESYQVHLIYAFEFDGVFKTAEDKSDIFTSINREIYEMGKVDGTISEGMIPKIDNAFMAIDAGVEAVVICRATAVSDYGKENFKGTVIR